MDGLPEFADDDIEVLMEALEAWEVKDAAATITTHVLDNMLARRLGHAPAATMKSDAEVRQLARDKRWRKERSLLLRAKLLQIRDRRHAESLTEDALR
jgi:hypothetical protein